MSDAPDPNAEAGRNPTRETHHDPQRNAGLEHRRLNLVRSWLRRSREASAAHTEAALDRASYESFPASDPMAPAASQSVELEPVHASMQAHRHERRVAGERRTASRKLLDGFERRRLPRRETASWKQAGAVGGTGTSRR